MKIALVTDAWTPQVNGVVRTLANTVAQARGWGHDVTTITPDLFPTIACPGYAEIRLALAPQWRMSTLLRDAEAEIVHIATEGPLGWSARRWCRRNGTPYTTAFHTRFPDYLAARTGMAPEWFWPVMRHFHAGSQAVLAATPTLAAELATRGVRNVRLWSRGVDMTLFGRNYPVPEAMSGLPRPVMLSVGRVAVEKNLEEFLALDLPGSKVVVGDGPALTRLREAFPQAIFLGALHGTDLAVAYGAADVFVFPSRTDTFGLVMLEALASGLPVAAHPVPGPIDILGPEGYGTIHRARSPVGALDEDLGAAVREAIHCDPDVCRAFASQYSWEACASQFLSVLRDAIADVRSGVAELAS